MLYPFFMGRDFTFLAAQPGLNWRVERCVWELPGGPETASISAPAPGGESQDWEALLRCPVELLDEQGQPAWWGYVAAVEQDGVRSSLDDLYNRVRVDYRYAPDSDPLHFFADDLASQEKYGQKELFVDLGVIDHSGQARSTAQGWLERVCRPAHSWQRGAPGRVRLLLRGWWHTLGWRYHLWDGEGLRAYESEPVEEANIGSSASTALGTQGFNGPVHLPAWSVSRIRLNLRKVGDPGDSLRVAIQHDSGGNPSGVELEAIEISAGGLTSSLAWYEYELPALTAALVAGRRYHIVFSRSGAANTSHYYRVGLVTPYPVSGVMYFKTWNGSSWVQRAPDSIAVYRVWGEADSAQLIETFAARERGGQFLSGVDVPTTSGRWKGVCPPRVRSYREEILDLLALGSQQGRLAALVTPARALRVFPLPARETYAALVKPDGRLAGLDGCEVFPHRLPLGGWALRERLPASVPVLVERVRWEDGQLKIG